MQGKIRRSLIAAAILGILFPSISLLYVRREGIAVTIMALFVASVLAFNYTDIAFFATSFWIFLLTLIFLCLISFILGIWYAWRGVRFEQLLQDKGLSWIMYVLLMLTFLSLLSNLPVSFFQLKENFANLYTSDFLVVQKTQKQEFFQAMDTVIFLDNSYTENIGQVLATPRDVLSQENGKIYRNDILTTLEIPLLTNEYLNEDSNRDNIHTLLEKHFDTMAEEVEIHSMNTAVNSWLVPDNTLLIRYPNADLALLPIERVHGKAIYVLFSKNLSQNGKSLTSFVIPYR